MKKRIVAAVIGLLLISQTVWAMTYSQLPATCILQQSYSITDSPSNVHQAIITAGGGTFTVNVSCWNTNPAVNGWRVWNPGQAGGGTPGGVSGNIQINSSGSFGAYAGSTCPANKWMAGLDASGTTGNCTQPLFSNISGTAALAQVPLAANTQPTYVAVASLPTCNGGAATQFQYVNNATQCVSGTTAVGGGSTKCEVQCNSGGTAWTETGTVVF